MEEEFVSAAEFFGGLDKQERTPLVRISDHKVSSKEQKAFEDSKVKMVMRIEGCGREEAVRLIEERSAELRAKENTRRNAHDFDFTK